MIKRFMLCLAFAVILITSTAVPFLLLQPAQAENRITVPTYQEPGNITINPDIKLLVPPAAPSNLTATVSGSTINLNWTDNAGNKTGFKIERKTGSGSYSQIATLGANVSSYSDTGLQLGITYYYRISAYNVSGDSGYSNEASATTIAILKPPGGLIDPGNVIMAIAPAAPLELVITVDNSNAANLTWKDNASNETGFKIEKKTKDGVYAETAKVGANTTTYAAPGLLPNITYYYRVKAYNAYGESGYSNEVNMTIVTSQYIGIIIKYYVGQNYYYVNGQQKTMDVAPIIQDGRVFLPARYVAEPLGAQLDWDETDQKSTVVMNGKTIELWIGKNIARVNGVDIPIDPNDPNVTPIVVPPGRIMIPVRFIAENLGCQVDWDQSLQEVKITYPKP